MSLQEKLDKIRSPKLQNQKQTAIVLSAVEDTLKDQKTEATPTGYFAALLALLRQACPQDGEVNKDLTTSVVYLLDIITPFAPQPLLRSKFTQILTNLGPALILPEADAPLLRPSIGCLESLLLAQDSTAWELEVMAIGPRRAIAGLLNFAVDHRPKIRKRAQEALANILKNPPPSPSLDHPAADMCAETALRSLSDLAAQSHQARKQRKASATAEHEPALIHALQLVKTVAGASGGWPSKKIEALCEVLLNISKSSNEYLAMTSFEVFEMIFEGMANETATSKLPRLLEVISELRPSQNDSQLLPPWIAVLSRGYDVSAQLEPEETFAKLPELFTLISGFMSSSSHSIRVSASECLISLMANCVPDSVIAEPSIFDEKVLEKLAKCAIDLLSVKYQAAWMETFNVMGSMFDALRWRADPILSEVVRAIGELRGSESFAGKKEADEILGKAIRAMGPERVLSILPLNLIKQKAGQPGRAWMLPILRDYVSNTNLQHFRTELEPLSQAMLQRVGDHGAAEKTMDIKIFETIVKQIWAILPGYCDLPLDLTEAFDIKFAEILVNILYGQVDLRSDICRALQTLIESNQAITAIEGEEDLLLQSRVSKAAAQKNIEHLATFASNMLSVLFNVYNETLPQYRGFILQCINAFLSITPAQELMETFERVSQALGTSLAEAGAQTQAEKQKQKQQNAANKMPPTSHSLMDLVITISIYLPRDSFSTLFNMAALIIVKDDDPQLQKKAYKLIPRLAESETGKAALQERSTDLQELLLNSSEKVSTPAKRDRLAAISVLIPFLPADSLHFIPAILSEVVISCKETNERARTTAFDLLILMGEKIASSSGAIIDNSKVSHMPDDAPAVTATLEEYFTMVSAGLAGSTPHMVSASITALTRILYNFRESLSPETVSDLVQTMDLFLTSNNREIVRSVLGFVKVCVISLPSSLVLPRLESLIPNLMVWSHEHKAHFKAKVKHILERMIRRFGVEIVNKHCPEEDKKLITNIRKTRERRKRNKDAAKEAGEDSDEEETGGKRRNRFENEYDEALHGSDSESSGSDVSDDEVLGKSRKKGGKKATGGNQYIVEDDDEPLDLLDRKALGSISTTKPIKARTITRTKAKVDLDGKLLLGGNDSDDDDQMVIDTPAEEDGGVGAYVHALKGRDAPKKGRGGRLKFSNRKGQDEDDEMDVDEDEVKAVKKSIGGDRERGRGGRGGDRGRGGRGGGRGGFNAGRRGLGEEKRSGGGGGDRSGRVMKSPRGRGRGNGHPRR